MLAAVSDDAVQIRHFALIPETVGASGVVLQVHEVLSRRKCLAHVSNSPVQGWVCCTW